MKRFVTLAWATLVVASIGIGASPGQAGASADPVVGMQVLDMLCEARGGTAFDTPLTISRCQEARQNKGFAIETLVCEGLLGGEFRSAPSVNRPNRTTWTCSPDGA